MLTKNAKYRVKNAQGVYEVVHLETNANQVIESEQKQFVSANEKAEWTGKATVESVTNVQQNVDKVAEDLASEVSRATGAEQGLNERISTLEGLVVGGEGEGLNAIIKDVAKNKADISDLQTGLSDEISARESADALINEELGRKADISDLQAEIARATGVEQGLDTRLSTVETKANTNEANIEKNSQAIAKEVVDRQVEIARVEGLVSAESSRAKAVEEALQTAIDGKVSNEEFTAEQSRVNSALAEKVSNEEFVAEQERVDGLFGQVNTKLEGHKTLIDTVTALAQENKENKADKSQVAIDIAEGVDQAKVYADGKLAEAKVYADGKLVEAKTYTNEELVKVNATISDLDSAYKSADVQVLADAKAHANKAVADLVNGAPEALDTLKELADAMIAHEDAYDSLLEVVGGKANSADVYTKTDVDGIKSALETSIGNVDAGYKTADSALDGRLSTVENLVNGEKGIEAINSDLEKAKGDILTNSASIEECKGSIADNTRAITKEVEDRTQADLVLDGKISAEKERAEAVEADLSGRLTTVSSDLGRAKDDILVNTGKIAEETAKREESINALDAKINNMIPVAGSVQPIDRAEGHIWIEIL